MPNRATTYIDLYFTANNRDTLAADLAPLALGLTGSSLPALAPASGHPSPSGRGAGGEGAGVSLLYSAHAADGNGHALDYAGKLVKTPAIYDTTGSSGTGDSPVGGEGSAGVPPADEGRPDARPILQRALNRIRHGARRAMSARETRALPTPKLITPAQYYARESANLRLFGPDAKLRAEKIRAAHFKSGTVVIPTPATPSRRWA